MPKPTYPDSTLASLRLLAQSGCEACSELTDRLASANARVEELSAVLNLTPDQQRDWRQKQTDEAATMSLKRLSPGRRTKLRCDVLVEAYKQHFQHGVNPHRIATTLNVDRNIISRFLQRDYVTSESIKAYEILGVTPK